MRPPPGGEPYFATTSGVARSEDLPSTSDLSVVGSLSSSTQMYSGSLATSPKRGFLIRSHLDSALLICTLGSFCAGRPASSLMLTQPERSAAEASRTRQRGVAIPRLIIEGA